MRSSRAAVYLLKPRLLPNSLIGPSSSFRVLSSHLARETDGPLFNRGESYRPVETGSVAPYSDDVSFVYLQALKFQCPNAIKSEPHLLNSASFIGTIISPVIKFTKRNGVSGVYSKLQLSPPPSKKGSQPIRILTEFYENLAQIASQHLQLGDFVYVSGPLDCFRIVNDGGSGKVRVFYKVIARDLNFVQRKFEDRSQSNLARFELQEAEMSDLGEPNLQKEEDDPLHLWQLFFSNPLEWWDNRLDKRNPRAPDFVHKDTRERIWIRETDPPWISSQLKLLDKRMAEHGLRKLRRYECAEWKFDIT